MKLRNLCLYALVGFMLVTVLASAIPPASASWQKVGDINPPFNRAETYYEGFQQRSSVSQKKSYAYADTSGYIETAVAIRNESPDTPGWQAEAKAWVDGLITTPSAPSQITNIALKWYADIYGRIYIACEVKIDFVVIVYDQYWNQKGTWTFTKYYDWHIPGQSAKQNELNEVNNLYQLNLAGLSLDPNKQYRFRLIAHNQVKMLYGSYHGYTYSGYGQIFSDFSGSYDLTVGQFRPSWMSPNPNWRMKINKMEVWGDVQPPPFDFDLSANPSSITVKRGQSAATTVKAQLRQGTPQSVSLSISSWGGSSGLTASFNPSSGYPTFTSTLTISASSSASLGSFTVTVWGSGGGVIRTTNVAVTVTDFDFSISASPSSITVNPGGQAFYTVTCTLLTSGSTQTVSLSASYSGSGLSHAFSPSSGTPTFTSTLGVGTASYTPPDTYTITITGTGGGKTHSTTVNLVVQAGGVAITIASTPSGRQVTVDGATYTAPVTFNWQQGSTHTLSAPSPQSGGSGIQYVWTSWSDGGGQTHTYITPSFSQTVTANFKTQYQLTISVASGGSSSPAPGSYWCDSGSSASVTANPPSGYVTAGWVLDGGAGRLKRNPNTGAIYYIYSNTKYWITSMDAYNKYGFSGSAWVNDPNVESLPSGYNLDGSNQLPDASTSISVTMNAAHTVYTAWVSPPSYTVTVTAYVDVAGNAISNVAVTLDGSTTKYTGSDGKAVFTGLSSGSHSVSVTVTLANGRQFSRFYDKTAGVDYIASNPYSFTLSGNREIDAYYKVFTKIVDLAWDGFTISGKLQDEWSNPLLAQSYSGTKIINRMVGLYYSKDGGSTWTFIAYTQASSTGSGSFSYSWTGGVSGVNRIAAFYDADGSENRDDEWFYMDSDSGQKKVITVTTYDVTIQAYCLTQSQAVSVSFTWDGVSYSTPKTFLGQSGSHTAVMPASDPHGHTWNSWSDGATNRTRPISSGGTYQGNYGSAQQYVTITFQLSGVGSDASGTILTIDGTGYSQFPKSFSWAVGSTHSVVAATPIAAGSGKQYVFVSWTNGDGLSGASGTYTTPSSSQTVTANYKTQYRLTMQVNPSGAGTTSPAVGSYWYDAGASVPIDAFPASGYTFSSWSGSGSGSYSGASKQATVTMNGPITETANFSGVSYTVAVYARKASDGSAISGVQITLGSQTKTTDSTGKVDFSVSAGTYSLSVQSPVSGGSGIQYSFTQWADGNTQNPRSITVSASVTYDARYKTQYYLTMQVNPSGAGTVSPSSGWRDAGSPVSISATPNSGYVFSSWSGIGSGSYSGTSNPASVTMNAPITETANFQPSSTTVSITITSSPTGSGFVKVDGNAITTPQTFAWTPGSTHMLEALSPVEVGGTRYAWVSWSDGGGQSHTYTTPSSSQTVTANFNAAQYLLTVRTNGLPASAGSTKVYINGVATTDDYGVSQINDGSANGWRKWYNIGVTVQVNIDSPVSGYAFSQWSGDASGSSRPVSVTLSSAKTVTANYGSAPDSVTVNIVNPSDGSTVSGVVAIKATVVDSLGHPIASVQYRIDSGSWQPMTWDGAFWAASWDSSSVSNGPHSITVTGTCSQGASGQDSVTVNVNNAAGPQYTFYINYAENPSGVWYPEEKFLPGETMGVEYNIGEPGRLCRISLSSSNILYTPKSPSPTVDVYSDSEKCAKTTFSFDLAKSGIYGSYTVTWYKLNPGGNPSNPADWVFVYVASFEIRGAKAENWAVSHTYDKASVNTFVRWDDGSGEAVLNRHGSLEIHTRFGPYNVFVKGLIRQDGSVSAGIPYYDWKGQVTFKLTYSGTAIDVETSALQRNLKTFTYDVLALNYRCEGSDYRMTAHLTYFLKYTPTTKVQGVRASLQCAETDQWMSASTDASGYTSITISIAAPHPRSFSLNAWAWVQSPQPALRDYIIAVQYTSITVAREDIAVQASISGAQLSGGYFTVKTKMTSGCQWMDVTATIKVQVYSDAIMVAEQIFTRNIVHGISNNIDLPMTGVGSGTYTVKIIIQYGSTVIGQAQNTVSV